MVSERIKSVKRNVVLKGMKLKRCARTPGPTPGVPYDVPRTFQVRSASLNYDFLKNLNSISFSRKSMSFKNPLPFF